jgi:hypothetical protein
MVYLRRYILNVLIGIEQLIMALCGGDPDETWSSLSWRICLNHGITWPYRFIDWLFYKGHCEESYEKDEGKYALWTIYKNGFPK